MTLVDNENKDDWINHKIGSTNKSGEKIVRIYSRRDTEDAKFLIYQVEDGTVRFAHKGMSTLWPEVGKVRDSILSHLTSNELREKYGPRIALALKSCLDGELTHANELYESILLSVKTQKTVKGRLEYLTGGVIGLFFCIVISILDYVVTGHNLIFDSNILIFGSFGGLLSMTRKLKRVEIDSENGVTRIHLVNGLSRILIAVLSSIAVFYLVESEAFLGFLNLSENMKIENQNALIYSLCLLSGFSENYVPNLLERIESKE